MRVLPDSVRPAIALATVLVASATFVGAAKPADVVAWSNGFPSGEHYNLNIHGKKEGFACDPASGGASIFVPEYGVAEIDIVQNRKSAVTGLATRDACGTFDGDPAVVQLPAGEYQVYARILAKPQKSGEPREVVFYPKLVEACNDTGTETFPDAVDCDESFLLGTGVVTSGGVFDLESQELVRTAGKSKALDVTALFAWTGYVCDQVYDTNGNGEIDLGDLPGDLTGDGLVDGADLAAYLAANCTYHASEWVFNIADLVVYGWDWHNSGSKLVQVRFYPTTTTEFL
ncbi:MAG: hypothetical protein ACT4PT_02745 [Methanobacteriota archaeon]